MSKITACGARNTLTQRVLGVAVRVGLSQSELDLLATAKGVLKLSRNDLPYAIATGQPGATTVAATMICARLAGIRVFATGGIGGVHRGAEDSFDISADPEELARTSVAVVCAGAKALLDLPKTLEYLETRGVPVIGYRTNEFPAFWSRSSGLPIPLRLDSAQEIARLLELMWSLGLEDGAVIANPVETADEIPRAEMAGYTETATEQALRNLAWVEETRRTVDRLSHGRLAYICRPDTEVGGYTFFATSFRRPGKEGAAVDERFNGGGTMTHYILTYLQRRLSTHQ
jgi:pseudouridine-5'-phosphate glycosidase